jgi:hypothetical protein
VNSKLEAAAEASGASVRSRRAGVATTAAEETISGRVAWTLVVTLRAHRADKTQREAEAGRVEMPIDWADMEKRAISSAQDHEVELAKVHEREDGSKRLQIGQDASR